MLVSRDDLEKILPFPIKIVICADDIFVYKNFNIRNKLQELLDIHNEKYETKRLFINKCERKSYINLRNTRK